MNLDDYDHIAPRFTVGSYVYLGGLDKRLVKIARVLPYVFGSRWYEVEVDRESGRTVFVTEDELIGLHP